MMKYNSDPDYEAVLAELEADTAVVVINPIKGMISVLPYWEDDRDPEQQIKQAVIYGMQCADKFGMGPVDVIILTKK